MQSSDTRFVKCLPLMLCHCLAFPEFAYSQEVEMETAAVETAAAPQQPATFDLLELRVKGNTLLEKKQLERTIYPYLGPKRSIENVEKARAALEELYRMKGYQTVAVDIPEQNVQNGVVYLQVVEGKISKLRVKDSRYFDQGRIKAVVPELAEGSVPNFPKMQEQLAELAQQSSDRQIVPVLRAGETPGTLEVDLKVQDELPVHGKVELNARQTQGTVPLRLVNSLHYDNLWQRMHSASIMYQVSPEDASQVDVWAGTYAMPVLDDGSRLAVYGVGTSSSVPVSVGADNVIGNGNIFGARFIKSLKASKQYFHTATLGVDYKDFKEDVTLQGEKITSNPIAYLPFLVQYAGVLNGETSQTAFDLGLHFSIRGLGNDQKEFDCIPTREEDCILGYDGSGNPLYYGKRHGAKSNYIYLTGNLKNKVDLPLDMELVTRMSGQAADTPLINNEQFSLGGAQSVRGYFETQVLTDDGVFGSLELYSPHLAPADWEEVNELKLLAFLDAGKGWRKDPLPGEAKANFLSSSGVGLRFKVWKFLTGMFDVGIALTDFNTNQKSIKTGDSRLHFSISGEF